MPGGFYKKCIAISFLISVLFFFSCVTTGRDPLEREEGKEIRIGQYDTSSFTYGIEDIQPAEFVYESISLESLNSRFSELYSAKANESIDYINKEDYKNAIDLLLAISSEYDDGGNSFYNLAYCYYQTGDYHNALQYAAYAGYAGYSKADDFINNTLFKIGYDLLLEEKYKKAISYFKSCSGIENAYQNILYAYIELAKMLPFPDNVIMLLYAGDYSIRNTIENENIVVLANELGVLLEKNPVDTYLHHTIEIIHYGLTVEDDPFLHKSLGLLYLYNHENRKAYQEFESIVKNKNADKELLTFTKEKLIELEKVKYLYKKKYPFTVKKISGSLQNAKLEFIFTLPQNNHDQLVTDIEVFLNNTPIEYEIIKDFVNTRFIKIHIDGLVKDENTIVIQAVVQKESKRFSEKAFEGLMISDYDATNPKYELYTKSTALIPLSHPEIIKIKKELKNTIKSNHVIEIVKAVYDYVIKKMHYEMYENENRPKNKILDRLKETNYSGVCEDYSVLTVALLRSYGIPGLNLCGPCFNSDIGHSWPAFFTPGYTTPVVIDTTWGDTGEMPFYYFLFNTNLTVIENFGWDSDIISNGYSSYYTASPTIKVILKEESTVLEKL